MKNKGLWILIAVVVIIVIWAFSGYNGMVDKQETATTAIGNVDAAYQRRADLLPNAAKTVKAYAKHERETFEEVTKARNAATQVHLDADNLTEADLQKYQETQNQVAQAFSKLIAVAEAYPQLKASENFKALQVQIEGCENRINEARRSYNEASQAYNQKIRHFPNSILAGIFGFEKMAKFQASAGAEKAPELDI